MFINTNDGIYHKQYADGTEYDGIRWDRTGCNGISPGMCVYIYIYMYIYTQTNCPFPFEIGNQGNLASHFSRVGCPLEKLPEDTESSI